MEIPRTPEERFANLPGFAFAPHYLENLPGYEGIRIHYLDEGPPDSKRVYLCLHGESTWSYLYRKMIPVFTAAGHRSVAPDFIGFGKSEKPMDEAVYTFTFHREMPRRFVEQLDLRNITLVCQDWGGSLGMTLPMDMPGRFARLLLLNTALANGDLPLGAGFLAWREFSAMNPDLDIAKLMARACETLSPEECEAYAAPFPEIRYKAGCGAFLRSCRTIPLRKEPNCRGARGVGGTRSGMDRRSWPWA
jgi:pimeloyl-ACP methyl ester carboxylesterase